MCTASLHARVFVLQSAGACLARKVQADMVQQCTFRRRFRRGEARKSKQVGSSATQNPLLRSCVADNYVLLRCVPCCCLSDLQAKEDQRSCEPHPKRLKSIRETRKQLHSYPLLAVASKHSPLYKPCHYIQQSQLDIARLPLHAQRAMCTTSK